MSDPLKSMLAARIEAYLKDAHNMSADLMKQCVRQDRTVFDERKLDAIDPRYKHEIWNMVKQKSSDAWRTRPPGAQAVDFVFDMASSVEREDVAAHGPYKKEGELGKKIDTTSDLNIPPKNLTPANIRNDIARALGHVTIHVTPSEVTIRDNFDFMQTFRGEPVQSTTALLFDAGMATLHTNSTRALNDIGRVFCKEGVNGAPTDSSIPVAITLKMQELGGFVPPAPPPSKGRAR